MPRRILRLSATGLDVASESRLESEARLHEAIAHHPEVLPSEDLGLGPLVTLGQELDFGHGPLDLLAVDASGRLAIVEFKRGTENPDVRRVIAQLLDYGAALWRQTPETLAERIDRSPHPLAGSLFEHVESGMHAVDVAFDPEAFEQGLAASLERGDFVFVYVARDLDPRTRDVMTYLAEGPRMTFFAVEVDYFVGAGDGEAVMVPRTAFIPSWRASTSAAATRRTPSPPVSSLLEAADEAVAEVVRRLQEEAPRLRLHVEDSAKARQFRPRPGRTGISVFPDQGRAYWDLGTLRLHGLTELADQLQASLTRIGGRPAKPDWPTVRCSDLLEHWPEVSDRLVEQYFAGWRAIDSESITTAQTATRSSEAD